MPVLGTKLHVPAMRRRLVSRSRLTDRLRVDPSSMPRFVLVSAPAGFGKTTLIAQWLASGERATGRVSRPGRRRAWRGGYLRLFLDEGPPMTELLRAAGHADLVPRAAAPAAAAAPSSDEALSDRELEVLRLLATELTGPEIARHLFVSVNTLRTHTKHIFTKLDVNTRRAAVRRGTELGLL